MPEQISLLEDVAAPGSGKKRKRPDGIATSDVTLSAHVGGNENLFPQILKLHVAPGSPQEATRANSTGSAPPKSTSASTSVSKIPAIIPNRDFSSV